MGVAVWVNGNAVFVSHAYSSWILFSVQVDIDDVTEYGDTCIDTSGDTIGCKVTYNGKCYEHVHEDLWSVYDFSYWAAKHPGNDEETNFYPISQNFAESSTKSDRDKVRLNFPASHSMSRWNDYSHFMVSLANGRLGDIIDFKDLTVDTQVCRGPIGVDTCVCGSSGTRV